MTNTNANTNTKTVLVIGGTGAMGRPVVRALLASKQANFTVRVLTRNAQSPEAKEVLAMDPSRVSLFVGSTESDVSLSEALRGVDGVFCNTNFFARVSVEAEYTEGVRALEAAKRAGVSHFVWSSLDPMGAISQGEIPVPHFDAKAAVGAYIDRRRADDFMRRGMPGFDGDAWYLEHTTVLVTLPYIENFKGFFQPYPMTTDDGRAGVVFTLPLGAGVLPMVGLDDIGAFAAIVLGDLATYGGKTLPIGSESLDGAAIAETFTRVTGVPSVYRPMSLAQFAELPMPFKHDLVNMMRFFHEHRLPRDHEKLRKIHPGLRTFESWLRESGWRGQPERVFKSAGEAAAK